MRHTSKLRPHHLNSILFKDKILIPKFFGQGSALPPRPPVRHIFRAALGGGLAISALAALAAATNLPLMLGSLGASCVFVFGLPEAPFAQPRNVIIGHLIGSISGLVFLKLCGPQGWALGLALATTIALMFATRTAHAPAGANPVIVFLTQPGWGFVFTTTLIGVLVVAAIGLLFNNVSDPRVTRSTGGDMTIKVEQAMVSESQEPPCPSRIGRCSPAEGRNNSLALRLPHTRPLAFTDRPS